MCTFALTLDDKLVEQAKPAFKDEKAMKDWLRTQMESLLRKKTSGTSSEKRKGKQKTEEFLKKLQELKNDREGFMKLPYLLSPCKWSDEELRDEYLDEKYGIMCEFAAKI